VARANFVERSFRCSICGDVFTALAGTAPVGDPVCMSCGLRYSPEKRRRLAEERKQSRRTR
jgi:rubredoxin